MSQKQLFDFNVGDEVFFVPSDRRSGNPCYHKITAKGRKYVTVGERKKAQAYNHDSYPNAIGSVNEYPHGHVYANEQDWLFGEKISEVNRNFDKKNLSLDQKERILAIIEESNEPFNPYEKSKF